MYYKKENGVDMEQWWVSADVSKQEVKEMEILSSSNSQQKAAVSWFDPVVEVVSWLLSCRFQDVGDDYDS